MKDNRYCLICRPKNRTLYWHKNENGTIWAFCNKCDRGYSLDQYCSDAGITKEDFIQGKFFFEENKEREVNALSWPHSFIPLSDPRAVKGVEYIKSRGLKTDADMYYDLDNEGIVFPYYLDNQFCGAQIRFIEERIKDDGSSWKITTLPGTRLGLLFGLWNQTKLMPNIKALVICEGYFNAVSLQQAFNIKYGGISNNPWKFICTSGSGVTDHQAETLKELKDKGLKVVAAFDTDDAGFKGIKKLHEKQCLTHLSVTGIVSTDWNDYLKNNDFSKLAELFIKNFQSIDMIN